MMALDLRFHAAGTAYQHRFTTRHEIPCLIDGTVTVAGETYTIKQQVGQKGHSWGVRDWWNMEWCWGTIHCDDLLVHFIDLKVLGSTARLMIGYVQAPAIGVKELESAVTTPTYFEDNLVDHTDLS